MAENYLAKLGGVVTSGALWAGMRTLDYRATFYDPSVDPARGEFGPAIYVFWHEYILCPLFLRGRCNIAMLLSRSRDADILARVARHFGYETIRGSTYRGAASAVRELMRSGKHTHLAITPDGPRGPRRTLAQGPVYLASKLGMPIVPFGLGFDRPWRARSWDRFAIPRPYTRARAVVSPPVRIDSNLSRAGIEAARVRVENLLRDLTLEAEAWAAAGTRKENEQVARLRMTPTSNLAEKETISIAAPHAGLPRNVA